MDRRQFVQTTVAAGVVAAVAPSVAKPSSQRRAPNIFYVFDDEHRFQFMPGEPFSDSVVALNLDAFRKANFSMDRCTSNYPLCSPYRGILMTGPWPFQNQHDARSTPAQRQCDMKLPMLRALFLSVVLAPYFASPGCIAAQAHQSSSAAMTSNIPSTALIQPVALAKLLSSPEAKPLVLQIGSHVLYAEAHIPGSEYVGAAGTDAGLDALRQRVKHLKKDMPLVIYCGCCPWGRCPNIRPAYQELHSLGFTQVKVLYLAQDFGADWVEKGYPVGRGR